jgi:hypothetical protein
MAGRRKTSLIRLAAALLGCVAMTAQSVAQTSCGLPQAFNDPHAVLLDDRSLFWVRPLQVDADGAPNAYHRDDPNGNRGLAIEYMFNGMTIYRNGEPLRFQPDPADNKEWLAAYRRIVANGWKAPPGYGVDIYGFARDDNGDVCITPTGRLTSSTSLVINPDLGACNPKRYVNALKFPGIVVPNRSSDEGDPRQGIDPVVAPPFAERGVGRGDLAIVYNPSTGIWKGAFLYDTGPRQLLGEGSLRLILDLHGRKQAPRSALETNSLGIVETFTVIFPGSVADLGPRSSWTPEKVHQAATERFKTWGGGSLTSALQRMFSCAQRYKSEHAPAPPVGAAVRP